VVDARRFVKMKNKHHLRSSVNHVISLFRIISIDESSLILSIFAIIAMLIFITTKRRTKQRLRANDTKFHEYNKGYTHERGQYVEMGRPRKCSHSKKTGSKIGKFIAEETITIGERIPLQKSPNGSADITPMPVELRAGINLRQLRAIKANV